MQAFEKINDVSNIALVHANLGRLMRHYAQFYAPVVNGVRQEFSPQERQSFQKAFDSYLRGLKLVENRPDLLDVYRTLAWELSNTYFTMATSIEEHPPRTTMTNHEGKNKGKKNLDRKNVVLDRKRTDRLFDARVETSRCRIE